MKIFHLPDLGEGLAEAEIREWYVKEGDVVSVDQPLVSMETAKAVVDVPSPYAGKILKLHGAVNDVIKTGAPFISYETKEEVVDKGSVVGKLETSEQSWQEENVIVGTPRSSTSIRVKAVPAARALAQEKNINLSNVKGTGPGGLITLQDVQQQSSASAATPASFASLGGTEEKLHGVKRMMAQAMAQSHQEIVPVTIFEDADITDLPADIDITVHLLKALVAAAQAEPGINAWYDGQNLVRKTFTQVNIGLAADTAEGLFVPVIKDVAGKSAQELRAIINEYKQAVRERSLPPASMQGATITLSNFGMIAGQYATPIIVPPQVAIVACGKSRQVPVVKEGKIIIGKKIPLSLSFDHRAATGGEATRFFGALIKAIENC